MNLQSGKYYWPATFPDAPSYQTLEEDLNCDVINYWRWKLRCTVCLLSG